MTEREREAYKQGFSDGLECFAWHKEGKTFVGTGGTTLREARELLAEGVLWNQLKQSEDLKFAEEKE